MVVDAVRARLVELHQRAVGFGGGLDFTVPLGPASIGRRPPLGPGFVDLSNGKFNAPLSVMCACPPAAASLTSAQRASSPRVGTRPAASTCLQDPEIGVSAGFGWFWGGDADIFGSGAAATSRRTGQRRPSAVSSERRRDVAGGAATGNRRPATTGANITVTAPNGESAGTPGRARLVVIPNAAAKATPVMIAPRSASTRSRPRAARRRSRRSATPTACPSRHRQGERQGLRAKATYTVNRHRPDRALLERSAPPALTSERRGHKGTLNFTPTGRRARARSWPTSRRTARRAARSSSRRTLRPGRASRQAEFATPARRRQVKSGGATVAGAAGCHPRAPATAPRTSPSARRSAVHGARRCDPHVRLDHRQAISDRHQGLAAQGHGQEEAEGAQKKSTGH